MLKRRTRAKHRPSRQPIMASMFVVALLIGGAGCWMGTSPRAVTPPVKLAPAASETAKSVDSGPTVPAPHAPKVQAASSPGRLIMTRHRQMVFREPMAAVERDAIQQQVVQAITALQAAIKAGKGGDFTLRDQVINASLVMNAEGGFCGDDGPRPADLARAVVGFGHHLRNLKGQNPVARGAMTVSLALAYDLLYDHLDREQRRDLAQTLVDQAMVIALNGSYRPRGSPKRQWWADSATNWSTLIIGGSVLSALCLRPEDVPTQVRASMGDETDAVQSWNDVRRAALADGLGHLERCFIPIIRNGGGTNEGNGYHHDLLLPLMLVAEAVHQHQHDPEQISVAEEVGRFLDRAGEGTRWQIQGDIHLGTPLPGVDFDYADGVWTLTDQPVTFLVATWARRTGASDWRMAAWMAEQRCTKFSALRAVFRRDFSWSKAVAEDPAGMADFRPQDIPTGYHLFRQNIPKGEPGTNEHLVVWRQRSTDPLAAAVMFKGGDRRQDRHSSLDAGTFTYVAQGVLWNRRPGWTGDYRYYYRDDKSSGREVTLSHLFAKRAVGQNTLVVNPLNNEYCQGRIPAPMTWLSQVNPDQAIGEDRVSQPLSPVEEVAMPPVGRWSAVIRYAPAYARHGVVATRGAAQTGRTMGFDPITGNLDVCDEVLFARPEGNEVTWGMFLSRDVTVEAQEDDRVLLSAKSIDHRRVYLAVARPGAGPAFRVLEGEDLVPAGIPGSPLIWRYLNGDLHRRTCRKLVLAETAVGATWTQEVHLRPLPTLADVPAEEARRRWTTLLADQR